MLSTRQVIKLRTLKWAEHVARMGERRVPYRVSVGKSDGMRPLQRPRRTWADIIKRDLRDFGCEGMTESIWLRIGTGGGLL